MPPGQPPQRGHMALGQVAHQTASERVGVHRYRFPAGEQAKVLLDLRTSLYDYPGKILWSRLRLREDDGVQLPAGEPAPSAAEEDALVHWCSRQAVAAPWRERRPRRRHWIRPFLSA